MAQEADKKVGISVKREVAEEAYALAREVGVT